MQLFYNPAISSEDKEVIFPKDESKHIVKVLRKQEGDNLKNAKQKSPLSSKNVIKSIIFI